MIHLSRQPWLYVQCQKLVLCCAPGESSKHQHLCSYVVFNWWPAQPDRTLFCNLERLLCCENTIKDHVPGMRYQKGKSGKNVQNGIFHMLQK